jgi:hypothetical protein
MPLSGYDFFIVRKLSLKLGEIVAKEIVSSDKVEVLADQ